MPQPGKPQVDEYAPYAEAYVMLVPDDGQLLRHMQQNAAILKAALAPLSDDQLSTPHAPGEWTVKEILLHLIDSERVFAYRALRIARQDSTPLPGFDQEQYVPPSRANERSTASIFAEQDAVRAASLALFQHLPEEAWLQAGSASGHRVTVRALAYQIVGHELHHLHSIRANYLA